jgi:branched-chain amino acid transport system ATP-binding protein
MARDSSSIMIESISAGCRALMTNPRLLILDEATEGLAPLIKMEIWDCLRGLKSSGQSILVVDKNIAALTKLADRHYIMEKGKIVWTGDSSTLNKHKEMQHRYLGI